MLIMSSLKVPHCEFSSASLSARRATGCELEERLLFLPVTPVYTLCPFNSTACPVIYNSLEVWKTLAKNSCSVCVEHSWNPAWKERRRRRRGSDFTCRVNLKGPDGGRIQCSVAQGILWFYGFEMPSVYVLLNCLNMMVSFHWNWNISFSFGHVHVLTERQENPM